VGRIGLPSTSANTNPPGSILGAARSAACHAFQAERTWTVVASRSIARRELLVVEGDGYGECANCCGPHTGMMTISGRLILSHQ
jgi:hypothetical protein